MVRMEPPFREVADRALFRTDAANPCEPRHRLPNGPARLDALEDARRIREPRSVPDGNVARAIDDGRVLYVEIIGDHRGPHETGFDSHAEVAGANRRLGPIHGAGEGFVSEQI